MSTITMNDYQLIDVHDSAQYLLVPEGAEAPEGLDDSIIVLQKPSGQRSIWRPAPRWRCSVPWIRYGQHQDERNRRVRLVH